MYNFAETTRVAVRTVGIRRSSFANSSRFPTTKFIRRQHTGTCDARKMFREAASLVRVATFAVINYRRVAKLISYFVRSQVQKALHRTVTFARRRLSCVRPGRVVRMSLIPRYPASKLDYASLVSRPLKS